MVVISEKTVAAIQAELDPDGSYGLPKIYATLKSLGLEPADIEPDFVARAPGLHEKVPKARADDILQQRKEICEGLRASRIHQVREALQVISDDDVRRFSRIKQGEGVRPIRSSDLPPLDHIDGVSEFKALQAKQMERVARDQARKANAICTDFLQGKKRAEEADARVDALNRRLKEYKQEQDAKWKAKRLELQKAEEKRKSLVERAAKERAEYEDACEEKANSRLDGARQRRAHHYSTENLSTKLEKAASKREAAFSMAVEIEEKTLANLEARQQATEERLYQRNLERTEYLENRRAESQSKFLEKQVQVAAYWQDWAENKLQSHNDFMTRCKENRQRGKDFMKDRSKSCSDIAKKARDKWRTNHDRLMTDKGNRDEDLMNKLAAATNRVENELKPMKLKCGSDVFTHLEVSHKTFGDLRDRRWKELQNTRDAQIQALCIKAAERGAKDNAKAAGQAELKRRRVEAAKDILKYQNEATAVFLKIQSEPNEARIRSAMQGLGFKMPKVGGEDEEEGAAS